MVKYGKEFRKNQNLEWKDKYFDYKAKKKKIKEYIKIRNSSSEEDVPFLNKLETWSKEFEQSIDKDVKKYIYFIQIKKEHYIKILMNHYMRKIIMKN